MAKPRIKSNKVVVLTGAGISAPSGLATFRDADGLWEKYRIEEVATPEAWARNPGIVLEFYNMRRAAAAEALPNAAHKAIADLESDFEVVVVTQNVDDLHERAGSTHVLHLHGELNKARSASNPAMVIHIGNAPIRLGDIAEDGGQLRPHIVWFGEEVMLFEEAKMHILEASRFLVVGTSLSVFPAARLVKYARYDAEKVIADIDPVGIPFGFRAVRGSADKVIPPLMDVWRTQRNTGVAKRRCAL